jgi:NADH-quinone oxidoreductase subunit N
MTSAFAQFTPALPEIILAIAAMVLLMFGVFRGDSSTRTVAWLSVLAFVVAWFALVSGDMGGDGRVVAFNGMFVNDGFALFMKSLVLLASSLAIIMSLGYIRHEGMEKFEYPILIVLGTLGMLVMISANDLMSLYLGIELQSLSLYIVASFKRDSEKTTEAGLKYFVLGALSSGMLLYGASMIYGYAGSTNFDDLAKSFHGMEHASIGLVVGMVFLFAGLAFKISAVPFHMWTPDVYEGAPTPVTAFFAVAPKIAALALFARVIMSPFGELIAQWQQILIVLSMASMVLGAVAAVGQRNIKRLMAYSSIGHVGFALVGLSTGSDEGLRGVLIYLTIYLVMNVGTFAVILSMRVKDTMVESIDDLAGLGRNQPLLAMAMAVFMFSLAGIPPLAGFFGKFYVFMAAINSGLYTLAIVGVLSSVIGAFYYLRIIKIMYFDEPVEAFEKPLRREMGAIMMVASLFTIFFFALPAPFLAAAQTAAQALLP